MNQRLTPTTIALLLIPPLLWAGNAVVGRAIHQDVPPVTLNFFRWGLATLLLLPLGYAIFRPGSGLWVNRRRYLILGLFGVGSYNALQYLALHTSSPVNVTLVASSMPVWMLLVGRLFYGAAVRPVQVLGAALSLAGVGVILAQGQWSQLLALRFVPGDLLMVLAAIIWSLYSWKLIEGGDSDIVRQNWATFMLAQVVYGAAWSALFAAVEWGITAPRIEWSGALIAAIAFVTIGPGIIAFRCWGVGVQRVGPSTASFFNNLTPLFAALLAGFTLGEMPRLYHALAFALILGGIVLSSRRSAPHLEEERTS
ncbi:MAG: DMT family transporter [Pseudomonadota bacterium]